MNCYEIRCELRATERVVVRNRMSPAQYKAGVGCSRGEEMTEGRKAEGGSREGRKERVDARWLNGCVFCDVLLPAVLGQLMPDAYAAAAREWGKGAGRILERQRIGCYLSSSRCLRKWYQPAINATNEL